MQEARPTPLTSRSTCKEHEEWQTTEKSVSTTSHSSKAIRDDASRASKAGQRTPAAPQLGGSGSLRRRQLSATQIRPAHHPSARDEQACHEGRPRVWLTNRKKHVYDEPRKSIRPNGQCFGTLPWTLRDHRHWRTWDVGYLFKLQLLGLDSRREQGLPLPMLWDSHGPRRQRVARKPVCGVWQSRWCRLGRAEWIDTRLTSYRRSGERRILPRQGEFPKCTPRQAPDYVGFCPVLVVDVSGKGKKRLCELKAKMLRVALMCEKHSSKSGR